MKHRVYVGTIGQGLFRSLDGGATFARAMEGMFVECHVRALVVDPRDPRRLLLGTELGLFESRDGADRWMQVESPLNGLQIWSLLRLPHDPGVILAGTCPSRLFRSDDDGRTWTEPPAELVRDCPRLVHARVTTLRADPGRAGTVWAGVEIGGLLRSTDAGRTWEPVGRGLSSLDIHDLVVTPARHLVVTNRDLDASTDGGVTWQPQRMGQTLPWSYCRTLAQLPGRAAVVLLGAGNGPPGSAGAIARSTDGGQIWQPARLSFPPNSTVWNFAVHPADPALVYASTVSGYVYRSTDGGESWEKLPREFGEVRALAWVPE